MNKYGFKSQDFSYYLNNDHNDIGMIRIVEKSQHLVIYDLSVFYSVLLKVCQNKLHVICNTFVLSNYLCFYEVEFHVFY